MLRKPPLRAQAVGRATGSVAEPEVDFLGVPAAPTVVGGDTPITGKLSFKGPTRIDAVLHGEVYAAGLLVIGERGSVDGVVRATQLIVLGEVRGFVCAARRVEVGVAGRLLATVETAALVIKEGGVFDGECRMPGQPGK